MALIPTSFAEVEQLSTTLAKSSLVPDAFRNKPADIFLAINYGMELGLPPLASLRAIVVIKGKASLYADAMVGIVLSRGVAEYFIAVDTGPDRATYETKRRGAPEPVRKTFSLEDAKNAGLLSNSNYKSYPRHMLEARAKAWLARDCYSDLLHGIYSAEEVSEFQERAPANVSQFRSPEPETIIDAEVIEDVARNLLDRVMVAESVAALQALASEIGKQPEKVKAELRAAFGTKMRQLKAIEAQREADEAFPMEESVA